MVKKEGYKGQNSRKKKGTTVRKNNKLLIPAILWAEDLLGLSGIGKDGRPVADLPLTYALFLMQDFKI